MILYINSSIFPSLVLGYVITESEQLRCVEKMAVRVPGWLALAVARCEAVASRLTKRPPGAPLTGVRLALRPCGFDNAKAREHLGFAPRPALECLPRVLDGLHSAGHL